MTWEERIIREDELSNYLGDANAERLGQRAAALVEHQRAAWPALRDGYEALATVETKRVQVQESIVVIQHNPKRIRSTAANVDKKSVEARRCFLCPDSLPAQEKGIEYGTELVILCNPFPVLDKHLSIVHREHIEQKIEGNVELLLRLASDLGSDYFVLYNGPECGASAPDHLHFQACSRALLPIEADAGIEKLPAAEHCQICEESSRGEFELFTLDNCGRSVIVFRGGNPVELSDWIYKTLDELSVQSEQREPMINIICAFDRVWTVYLFPRARHRPSCFYAEGTDRLIVSPGAIDMAGVVVVPEREHFERIGSAEMEAIFKEVSADRDAVNEMVERICGASVAEEF